MTPSYAEMYDAIYKYRSVNFWFFSRVNPMIDRRKLNSNMKVNMCIDIIVYLTSKPKDKLYDTFSK